MSFKKPELASFNSLKQRQTLILTDRKLNSQMAIPAKPGGLLCSHLMTNLSKPLLGDCNFCLLLLSLPASLLSVMVCVVGLSPGQYFYFQEVFPTLAAKQCIMQANAEYHQSILAKQQKKFGEEIARLQVSLLVINV
jgi:hypothetical protein